MVQCFLLVNLALTFSPVLKAAAFSLEAMDWSERFPRGSAVRGLSLLPAPGRRGVLCACQEQLSQCSTSHSQAPADPSSLAESIQPCVRVHLMGGALDWRLQTLPPVTERELNLSASFGLKSSTRKMMGKMNASLFEQKKFLNS